MPNGNDLMTTLINAQIESMEIQKKATTHCWELNLELMKQESPHFKKVDTHYTANGLLSTYKCSIDGRTYNVHITPAN